MLTSTETIHLYTLLVGERFLLPRSPESGTFEVIEGDVPGRGEKEAFLRALDADGRTHSLKDVGVLNGYNYFVEVLPRSTTKKGGGL